ncbi:hypothetical protein QTP88_010679 [Uroleucon formosanum]
MIKQQLTRLIPYCDHSTSEEDKVKLNEEHELHLRKAEAARNGMDSNVQAAKIDNQTTVIAFDLMKTLATPSLSVDIAYYKRQLWTYNLGIHNLSTNDAYMYVWDESIASRGPQEIGSCILHFVKNHENTEKETENYDDDDLSISSIEHREEVQTPHESYSCIANTSLTN